MAQGVKPGRGRQACALSLLLGNVLETRGGTGSQKGKHTLRQGGKQS